MMSNDIIALPILQVLRIWPAENPMRTHVKMADPIKVLLKRKWLLDLCRKEISRVRIIQTLPTTLSIHWTCQQRSRFGLIHSWAPLSQSLVLILKIVFGAVFMRSKNWDALLCGTCETYIELPHWRYTEPLSGLLLSILGQFRPI